MRVAAAVLLLPLVSCVFADRYRNARAPDAKKITILVPGYQGSFLYRGDERLWTSPLDVFSKGSRSLGSCDAGRVPAEPGGPITGYMVFPVTVDIYGGLMDWADARLPGFVGFGYDWRDSLPDTAQRLCDFIGDRQADLIAHSMGGLVAWLAIKRCGAHIDRAVFAATPFAGAPGIFQDLFHGTKVVNNTALLSPPALWTFSSAWQLLPMADDFFVDAQDQPARVPISDPADWQKWPQACPALLPGRLADRSVMRAALQQPAASMPRTLVIIGRGRQAISGVRWTGDGFDLEHPVRAEADGTVLVSSAMPAFKADRLVYTGAAHVELLNDEGVRAAVLEFLTHEAPR
jgi:pimeloyl-ACP methyl ester carboxylesterase